MGKKLSKMTWQDVQDEMSIAGDPEKVSGLGREIEAMIVSQSDLTNRATLTNIEFMLQRITAEVRQWQREYDKKR